MPTARILYLEDDIGVASPTKAVLEQKGYSVTHVEEGMDALTRLLTEHFDGAICDLTLPDVDGLKVIESVRSKNARLPIIILSARSDTEEKLEGLRSGGNDYLTKPFAVEAYRREEELRAIEETQWWLQCLATSWIALLDETEKNFLAKPFIGTSSNVSLPLPEPSKTPRDVLSTILHACDWEALFERTRHYDASVGAVQSWVRSIDGLLQYQSSLPFIDLCRLAADQTKLPMNRVRHSDVHICTPMQAFGVASDLTLFVGIR